MANIKLATTSFDWILAHLQSNEDELKVLTSKKEEFFKLFQEDEKELDKRKEMDSVLRKLGIIGHTESFLGGFDIMFSHDNLVEFLNVIGRNKKIYDDYFNCDNEWIGSGLRVEPHIYDRNHDENYMKDKKNPSYDVSFRFIIAAPPGNDELPGGYGVDSILSFLKEESKSS